LAYLAPSSRGSNVSKKTNRRSGSIQIIIRTPIHVRRSKFAFNVSDGVIRDWVESAVSPAMSAMPPKAEIIQSISDLATGYCGLMALPKT
jgi:hypothetical protein